MTGLPAAPEAKIPEVSSSVWRDLTEIVTDLWRSRELLSQLAKRDIKIRYKQAVMGFAWAVFMPILIVLAGLVVRLALASVGGVPMKPSATGALAVKGLCWSLFVGTIGFATASLTGNTNLISKIYFPREVLPLSSLVAQCFDTSIATIAVAIALPFFGFKLTPALAWVPLLVLLLILFTAAVSLFLSCANLFFRDVKYLVQVVLTFGVFFTPVLFDAEVLGPRGASLVMLNPLAPILEGLRLAIFEGHSLLAPLQLVNTKGLVVMVWQPWYLGYALAWALGGLAASALMFHRAEFAFAEYV